MKWIICVYIKEFRRIFPRLGINDANTLINFFDEESIYYREEIAEDDQHLIIKNMVKFV